MIERKSNNIVEPSVFQAIILDGIDQKLKTNNTLLGNIIDVQNKLVQGYNINNEILNKTLETQNKLVQGYNINNEILNKTLEAQNKTVEAQNKTVEAQNKTVEAQNKTVEAQNDSFKLLSDSIEMLKKINNEQLKEADEGEYIRRTGTASTTFTTLDLVGILGFYIKGYTFKNDGDNIIYVGHNITDNSLDVDADVANSRFETVYVNEEFKVNYNRKKIRNIYFKTTSGTSPYRLILIW